MRNQVKIKTTKPPKVLGNAGDLILIDLGFLLLYLVEQAVRVFWANHRVNERNTSEISYFFLYSFEKSSSAGR